jgi:hypothetical protein
MKSLGDAPYIDLFSDEYRDDAGGVLDRVRSETGLVQTRPPPVRWSSATTSCTH